LYKVQFESISAAAQVVGHDWALRIAGALRFGKPIEQFYGLDATLAEIQGDLPSVATVVVTNPAGQVLNSRGQPPLKHDLAEAIQRRLAAPAGPTPRLDTRYYLVFPIQGRNNQLAGTLTLVIQEAVITEALKKPFERNLQALAMVALAASMALLIGMMVFNRRRDAQLPSGWRLYAWPLIVMLVAQGVYTWDSIDIFRNQYLGAVKDST
jgi:hypothetical protein